MPAKLPPHRCAIDATATPWYTAAELISRWHSIVAAAPLSQCHVGAQSLRPHHGGVLPLSYHLDGASVAAAPRPCTANERLGRGRADLGVHFLGRVLYTTVMPPGAIERWRDTSSAVVHHQGAIASIACRWGASSVAMHGRGAAATLTHYCGAAATIACQRGASSVVVHHCGAAATIECKRDSVTAGSQSHTR